MSIATNDNALVQADTLVSIYAAAVSLVGWSDVIDRCAADAGAQGGAFLTFEAADPASYSVSAMGQSVRDTLQQHPDRLKEFLSDISPLEVLAHEHMRKSPARRIWREFEAWPPEQAEEARTHYDWNVRNLNIGPKLIVRLNDHPRIREAFVLHFLPGHSVPDSAISSLTSLIPHLAKSSEMSVLYTKLQQRYSAVFAVLDKVDVGLCVLDSSGRVIVKNCEATRMLEAGYGLSLSSNSYLQCRDSGTHADLINAIDCAQLHSTGTRAEKLIATRCTPISDPLLIEVSPLHDTLDELNYGLDGVLVQLIDTCSRAHCSVDAFAAAYELTQAEKSVTEYLLDGLSNRQISEERGTSIDTVKVQISNVMQKANSRSRVELVRCVLKTQPPIQGL